MHEKVLIANAEFFADIASLAKRRIALATKLSMQLEESNANISALNRLRKLLLESRDDFNALAGLVLDQDFNIIVDQAYIENYIESVYGLEPSESDVRKMAASIRRAVMFGFIGVDL